MVANYKQIQLTVDLSYHILFERPDIINLGGLEILRKVTEWGWERVCSFVLQIIISLSSL